MILNKIEKKKNIPWNKGLTKETDSRVKACADKKIGKVRLDMIGHKWNIGRKQSLVIREKRSIAVKKYWDKNKGTEKVLLRNKKISDKMLGKKKNYKPWNYIDGKSRKEYTYGTIRKLLSHVVWCEANQIHRVPDGCVIHHLDLNPLNDKPENLQLLEDRYHRSLHNQIYKIIKGGGVGILTT